MPESAESPVPCATGGLHHVTAIASDPQTLLDFHTGFLGLRLVKRTVNFDDPGTWHFYLGDARGAPGTILTFFAWPGARRGRPGSGGIDATAFAIRPESMGYWIQRMESRGVPAQRLPRRFGEEVVRFADPDGLRLELIACPYAPEVEAWTATDVPATHTLRGFHSVSAAVIDRERTASLLTEVMGLRAAGENHDRFRFTAADSTAPGAMIDLIAPSAEAPASGGSGSVHHIAFRVPGEEQQLELRERLIGLGYHVSPVLDRVYFRSIYFRGPGGILFEIATDHPGFTHDETVEELGSTLRLPPWLEGDRRGIESALPPIHVPRNTAGP